MSLIDFINNIGFKAGEQDCPSCDVEIQDGKLTATPYQGLCGSAQVLSRHELGTAYERISCVGTSVDLIANNMQMIEPVFWDPQKRETKEYLDDQKLIAVRSRLEKPNATDNRKTFISKCVKNYVLFGAVYYAFIFDLKNQITSIKVIDDNNVSPNIDVTNSRVSSYKVMNAGTYDGEYIFNGRYYVDTVDPKKILAPYINSSPDFQYMPASILQGSGIETLMYWYGCYHNKSLLANGATPSLIIMLKSLLHPKLKEKTERDFKIKYSGVRNAGGAIIMDGAGDKDIKQFAHNNRDMEFSSILEAAESAINKRLGTNWVLDKKVTTKDLQKGMEMFFDMTVCPLFQGFYNHIFDVYKSFNDKYSELRIFYLEQDVPALRPRFLSMMKDMPSLGIFKVSERRAMFNYQPLGDYRDDELAVQSVKVTQTGASGENTTGFSGG